jgi:hypothetical protein
MEGPKPRIICPRRSLRGPLGICVHLYGKTSSQLSAFHGRLVVLQRYLLANSVCDSLNTTEERDKARAALIVEISRGQPTM